MPWRSNETIDVLPPMLNGTWYVGRLQGQGLHEIALGEFVDSATRRLILPTFDSCRVVCNVCTLNFVGLRIRQ